MAKKKTAKKLGKKDLKKTKGGILIGLNQPTVNLNPTVSPTYKELGGGDLNTLNFVKF